MEKVIVGEYAILKQIPNSFLQMDIYNGSIVSYPPALTQRPLNDVEKMFFSVYTLYIDMSLFEFSKGIPLQKTRSERSMNIQALYTSIDSIEVWIARRQKSYEKNLNEPTSHKYAALYYSKLDTSFGQSETFHIKNDSINMPNRLDYKHSWLLSRIDNGSIPSLLRALKKEFSIMANESLSYIRQMKEYRKSKAKYEVEIHKKYAIPIACFLFALLGAPLGIIAKRGNIGVSSLIASVILTLYWISLVQGEKFAERLYISPFWGMWLGNIVIGLLGVILAAYVCLSWNYRVITFFRRFHG